MEPKQEKPAANVWANFLVHEKLDPAKLIDNKDVASLVALCERLAAVRRVEGYSHPQVLANRRLVCETAIDMGIDLLKIKRRKHGRGTKPAVGRGLLDAWAVVYRERFGSTVGTSAEAEDRRRRVVGKLSKEMRAEKPE